MVFPEISYNDVVRLASRGNIEYISLKPLAEDNKPSTNNDAVGFLSKAKILVKTNKEMLATKPIQHAFLGYPELLKIIRANKTENIILAKETITVRGSGMAENSLLPVFVFGKLTDGGYFVAPVSPDLLSSDGIFKDLTDNNVAFWQITSQEVNESNFWNRWFFLISAAGTWACFLISLVSFNRHLESKEDKIEFEIPAIGLTDVAGIDEAKAEIEKVLDFIRSPEHYKSLGAALPKGILLEGPPGVGKTLLAKAIAGESNLPFIDSSGSGFVEIFVGTGPKKVRELFTKARRVANKTNGRVILFIDEIDAIGKRGNLDADMGGAKNEYNNTINELLKEIDGVGSDLRIIILGATNKPENIDIALLRPGRFSKKIVLPTPDIKGRVEILKIHTKSKKLAPSVNLEKVARLTRTGTTGADLMYIANEAAVRAGMVRKKEIEMEDFEKAIEELLVGSERKSLMLNEKEKLRLSVHEGGHAMVAIILQKLGIDVPLLKKISIIPTTKGVGGYNQFLDKEERFIQTKEEYNALLCVLFGGRIGEEIMTGEISSGAHDDYAKASSLAEQMVMVLGMETDRLGQRIFVDQIGPGYLGQSIKIKDLSPETLKEMDAVIKEKLDLAYNTAKKIIQKHKEDLDFLAKEIREKETLEITPEIIERISVKGITKDDVFKTTQ